jgi:hypothetical protein
MRTVQQWPTALEPSRYLLKAEASNLKRVVDTQVNGTVLETDS